ncbi:hypothetical protein Tco_0619319 [Tanacetum coccineum]
MSDAGINGHSIGIGGRYDDAIHVIRTDISSDRQMGSGLPLGYKHIGSYAHSSQHCGALFWYEERMKNTARGARPCYNHCSREGWVALRKSSDNIQLIKSYLKILLPLDRGENSVLRRDIVKGLIDLLDTHNALVQLFRMAREKFEDTHIPNFKVCLYNVVGAQEYELPTGDMLGAIVYETGPEADMDYDIVWEER